MGKEQLSPEIELVKNDIINRALIFGSILGSAAYLAGLSDNSSSEIKTQYLTDLFVISTLILITIFRKKINLENKTLVIIITIFLLIAGDVMILGLYSENKVLLIIIPFLSYITYSYKKTIIIYIVSIAAYLALGYLHFLGFFGSTIDYNQRILLVHPWIINVLLTTIVALVVVVILKQFDQASIKLISDLKTKNIEIANSEQNYREIFESSTDGIFIHDLEGNILDINSSVVRMYGYDKKDLIDVNLAVLGFNKEPYAADNAKKYLEEASKSGEKHFDWLAKKKTGELFWVEVSLKRTQLLGDERILAIVRDIDEKKETRLQLEKYKNHLESIVQARTEELEASNKKLLVTNKELYSQRETLQLTLEKLKNTQNQLLQSEKMASLGVLSAGVAHEINNPLNFIQGGLTGLETYFEENKTYQTEDTKQLLEAINEGINRTVAIVKSLNHFSRQDNTEFEFCDINVIIENCLIILQNQLRNKIRIIKNFSREPLYISGNDGKLHQAILNILSNAEQAVEDKGIIEIQTFSNNGIVNIFIKDSGIGIKRENLTKITDPFFTTKKPGEGTGLGLSITYSIIKEHFGELEYRSEYKKGTTAIITLPSNTKQ